MTSERRHCIERRGLSDESYRTGGHVSVWSRQRELSNWVHLDKVFAAQEERFFGDLQSDVSESS